MSMRIPLELHEDIIRFLGVRDGKTLARVALVCSEWQIWAEKRLYYAPLGIANDAYFTGHRSNLGTSIYGTPAKKLAALLTTLEREKPPYRRCLNVQWLELSYEWFNVFPHVHMDPADLAPVLQVIYRRLANLRYIFIRSDVPAIYPVGVSFPSLESVTLPWPDPASLAFLVGQPNVTSLYLGRHPGNRRHVFTLHRHFPQLKHLTSGDWHVLNGVASMDRLFLDTEINRSHPRLAVSSIPTSLCHLELRAHPQDFAEILEAVALHIPAIQTLSLHHSKDFRDIDKQGEYMPWERDSDHTLKNLRLCKQLRCLSFTMRYQWHGSHIFHHSMEDWQTITSQNFHRYDVLAKGWKSIELELCQSWNSVCPMLREVLIGPFNHLWRKDYRGTWEMIAEYNYWEFRKKQLINRYVPPSWYLDELLLQEDPPDNHVESPKWPYTLA